MITRSELKNQAKEQIRGNIGTLLVISIIIGIITATVIGSFLAPVLSLGLISIYLGLTKGTKASISDVFDKLDLFGRALWLAIITGFFTFLWSMLFIIPGIIKSYSYSMAPYILADKPELTARQALIESKRITNGHKGELFVLDLSFFFWHLLCVVTLGIAYIYVMPYISATAANFYNAIKSE